MVDGVEGEGVDDSDRGGRAVPGSLETTAALTQELGAYLATVPEVTDYQAYAGTSAPINFNGLVRHSYLREKPELGELQSGKRGELVRRESPDLNGGQGTDGPR
mgnify:CR=1 FL=1